MKSGCWSERVGSVKVRHLVERQRKGGIAYYWIPTKALIAAGFAVARLPNAKGAAIDAAEALNGKVDSWRMGASATPTGPAPWTLDALSDLFQSDGEFASLAPRSRRDFSYAIKPALTWAGDTRVASITRLSLMTWLRIQADTRGPGNARNTGAALRRLLAFGRDQGWIRDNPATGARLPTPPSRARVWSDAELTGFCAAAETQGHPSMALAVMLGWCLGQRPADLRTMAWSAYDGRSVTLRQAKTGREIKVPALPNLRRLLDAAARVSPVMVVSETTGRPYRESAFQHEFARIRTAAGLPNDLQYRDLRRTVATALGAAGCTDDQIRAVTGHRTRSVVAVYVRPDDTFAKGAIAKLEKARRTKS